MNQLVSTWQRLDLRRKVILLGAIGLTFAAILSLAHIASRPGMALLYSGLDPAAAGEVVGSLEQMGVQADIRGDAIFVPSMWWHHVQSFSDYNILINYWWTSAGTLTSSPSAALMHGILAVRDLPERQRLAWQKIFEHYVFSADESVYEHIPEAGRGCLTTLDKKTAKMLHDEMMRRLG